MPDSNTNMKWFLAVATTLGVFAIVGLLFYKTIPEAIVSTLFTMLGIIIGKWGTIVDFNFGSSSGSAAKSDTIAALTGTGDGTQKTIATMKTEINKTVTTEPKIEVKTETPQKEGATP